MTALAERTVEVTPLGLRGRYSLTPALQRCYLAIVRLTDAAGGIPPRLDDVRIELGLAAKSSIVLFVTELEERNWVVRDKFHERGIHLIEPVLRHLKPAA